MFQRFFSCTCSCLQYKFCEHFNKIDHVALELAYGSHNYYDNNIHTDRLVKLFFGLREP